MQYSPRIAGLYSWHPAADSESAAESATSSSSPAREPPNAALAIRSVSVTCSVVFLPEGRARLRERRCPPLCVVSVFVLFGIHSSSSSSSSVQTLLSPPSAFARAMYSISLKLSGA